jgi:hypothetical protein
MRGKDSPLWVLILLVIRYCADLGICRASHQLVLWDFLIDLSISSARMDKTAGQRDARSADDKPTEKVTSVMRTYIRF